MSTNHVNLETLARGAFAEKINEALLEVAANIQNPNTDPTAKREITVKLKFSPNKTRQVANTAITVQTKLAPTEAIDTEIVMGKNHRTGKFEVAEYDPYSDQVSMDDLMEQGAQPEEAPADVLPTDAPLDLRKRRQDSPAVEAADIDPETGEIIPRPSETPANKPAARLVYLDRTAEA